jgi:elongation factor 1-alpha
MAEVQRVIEEYRKRFEFAYFLDSYEEELKEERTIDTTRVLFKGRNYYTVVDVPGHREFIKNMLSGASHAQVGILVVAAPNGVEEQTRRHTFLLKMLGINRIMVAINKMDLMDYREDAFNKTKAEASRLLSSFGYSAVQFIPVSAMEGDNVYKPSENMPWHSGPTLIQVLDAIEPEREVAKPLRFVVQFNYTLGSEVVTVGRVEAGIIRTGDDVLFQPTGLRTRVERTISPSGDLGVASAGDSIGVVLTAQPNRGDVGAHPDQAPPPLTRVLGEVVLLEGRLRQGDRLQLKCATKKANCTVRQIRERMSSETGEVLGKDPIEIGENDAATILFETEPFVAEKFSDIPELGRFVLARGGRNVAAGVVLETAL